MIKLNQRYFHKKPPRFNYGKIYTLAEALSNVFRAIESDKIEAVIFPVWM